tara:strand:+ start:178 stop:486 length:309 start_codon:yes stop_codon:yes gene_type:complete
MSEFKDVTIVKAVNSYFEGQVTSRTIKFSDGSEKTLGFMLPGKYEFSTTAPEMMEIISGKLFVSLPGEKTREINGDQSFDVPGNAKFTISIIEATDYCCSYL